MFELICIILFVNICMEQMNVAVALLRYESIRITDNDDGNSIQ